MVVGVSGSGRSAGTRLFELRKEEGKGACFIGEGGVLTFFWTMGSARRESVSAAGGGGSCVGENRSRSPGLGTDLRDYLCGLVCKGLCKNAGALGVGGCSSIGCILVGQLALPFHTSITHSFGQEADNLPNPLHRSWGKPCFGWIGTVRVWLEWVRWGEGVRIRTSGQFVI